MTLRLAHSALAPLSIVVATVFAGCPDDHEKVERTAELAMSGLSGAVTIDPSYPETDVLADFRLSVSCTTPGFASSEVTPVVITGIAAVEAGGARVELPGQAAFGDTPMVTANAAGVEVAFTLTGASNASYLPVCELDEPTFEVTVEVCGTSGSIVVPVYLRCFPDRRAADVLDLVSSAVPAGMPCRSETTDPFSEGLTVQRFGYDQAGRHLFTDQRYGDEPSVRTVYTYDAAGHVILRREVGDDGLTTHKIAYERDAEGRIVSDAVELVPHYLDDEPWRATHNYTYNTPDDEGWAIYREDGSRVSGGSWNALSHALRDTDESGGLTLKDLVGEFDRESWLGASRLSALHRYQPAEAVSESSGGRAVETWEWEEGRIVGDAVETSTGLGGLTLSYQTRWFYDCTP